ncbi:MAG: hypothetical protein KDB40_18805 [Acidimicrobiales bacterium]|nr:hypothetical protein [Acidimicrobiales bacterium]MCB9394023.1 hypothetical protein [Acidimicrobiaceae bacterium]
MDLHSLHQLVHERAPFGVVGFVPDEVERELLQDLRHLLELLGQRMLRLRRFSCSVCLRLDRLDLAGEPRLLLAEELRRDVVLVVQLQELLQLPAELGGVAGPARLRRVRAAAVPPELGPDRSFQLLVGADQTEAELRSSVQTGSGSTGDLAALASVLAAIDRRAPAVPFDAQNLAAQTTAHLARQEVLATPTARDVRLLCRRELLGRDQGLVHARVPLAAVQHFAEVRPVQADVPHRRVLHARRSLDLRVRHALRSELKDPPDDQRLLVLLQEAVDEVVPGRSMVLPATCSRRLVLPETDVLHHVLAVVLSEHAVDACLHPT